MAIIKKKIHYQGLHTFPIYKEDTDNSIFRIINIPSVFPSGKTYFIILGSDLLKQETDLKIEILDVEGNVVYHEIPFYLESAGRAVSIWVYEDTPIGEAILTIMGELKNVPDDWKGTYNVRTQQKIVLNPYLVNNSPIRFEKNPIISVYEIFKNFVVKSDFGISKQIYSQSLLDGKNVVSVVSRDFKDRIAYTTNRVDDRSDLLAAGTLEVTSGKRTAEPKTVYEIILTTGSFSNDMIGGVVYVPKPNWRAKNVRLHGVGDLPYTASIKSIRNTTTAIVDPPFTVTNIAKENVISNFTSSEYKIEYFSTITGSDTVFSSSFAKIDLYNLRTFSGKISSLRIFY